MRRMAQISKVDVVTHELDDIKDTDDLLAINKFKFPKGVEVFEIKGPFFFGAAYKFKDSMRFIETPPKVLILRMRHVPVIDSTGIHTLQLVFNEAKSMGAEFVISGIQRGVFRELYKSRLSVKIGRENILPGIEEAIKRAEEILVGKK